MTQASMFPRASGFGRARGGELIVDNFAGGGGASTGIELALGRSVDVAINHDAQALEMHAANHPETHHVCEDVWAVDPVKLCGGRPVGVAWFSPDCKHFSRAKGAKPVSRRIRGLAWVAVKWAKAVRPRVIFLENVREFQEWGPLDAGNRPCPKRKGRTFGRFVAMLRNLGYAVEWRVLNAADYGAPTHRRRLFLVARRDGVPIAWPVATHGPKRSQAWRTAAECINWQLPCRSIFGRKKPLAEKTMRRIAMGLKKYVLENPRPFIVNVQHGGEEFRGQEVDRPLQTVTAKHGYGVVAPYLVGAGGPGYAGKPRGVNEPVGVIIQENHKALVAPSLVEVANSNWSEGHKPADAPLPTVTAQPKGGSWAMMAAHLTHYHSEKPGEKRGRSGTPETPLPTQDTSNRFGLVAAFLNKYRGDSPGSAAAEPVPTITSGGGAARPAGAAHALGLSVAHLTKFYGTNVGADPRQPLPTVTANGQHLGEVRAFLIAYFGKSIGQGVAVPLNTITSHDRFGLVTVHGVDYAIADIGLRMLTPRELLRAQFGPELAEDYQLPKTAAAAVAKIGNSVPPLVAAALVRANCGEQVTMKEST